jgi:hypothetical protein
MTVNNMGCPQAFTTPQIGVMHDSKIYERNPLPLYVGERTLGDLAYIKFERTGQMIVPFKRLGEDLSSQKRDFNTIHSYYRSIVGMISCLVSLLICLISCRAF